MHKPRNICPVCNGSKSMSTTTFTLDFGDGVIVIRHVPAEVCEQCGEEWLDDKVAEGIENIVMEAKEKRSMVEVTEYISTHTQKAS